MQKKKVSQDVLLLLLCTYFQQQHSSQEQLGHSFGDLLYLQSAGYFYMIIPDIVKGVVGARVVNIYCLFVID
ncbi:MAG TPA: hypothetical protein VKA98_04410 [Nitrososphaeraceae archaeon]|nr:hypothetical protein [Nitrososphaeraceae archaeon]